MLQTLLPPGGPEYHGPGWGGQKEYVLDDDDCPLAILMHTPPNKGNCENNFCRPDLTIYVHILH